jgi:hypothetical protein
MATEKAACEHVIRCGTAGFRGAVSLRCASLAVEGSRYCAVHRKQIWQSGTPPQPSRTAKVKRDLDLDILPWTEEEKRRGFKIGSDHGKNETP